jgi:hypothetical protein
MTENNRARIDSEDSSEEVLGKFAGKKEQESEIAGLKRGLEQRLRDLDSLNPTQPAKQAVAASAEPALSKRMEHHRRDHFERLLREGSMQSQAKIAEQNKGCIPLLLIFSFFFSLAFPLFWIVFVLLLLGALASSGREWMG